jgi:molybdopterin-containing oxidoreductase family membrane subunit
VLVVLPYGFHDFKACGCVVILGEFLAIPSVLLGNLLLNVISGWKTLATERNQVTPPKRVRLLIIVSIPWAVSTHTATAFL